MLKLINSLFDCIMSRTNYSFGSSQKELNLQWNGSDPTKSWQVDSHFPFFHTNRWTQEPDELKNNVWAWMLQRQPELTIRLLNGERVHLVDDIDFDLQLTGFYSLKDGLYFRFYRDTVDLGGVDQSLGGCVCEPGSDPSSEDYELMDKCTEAVDKLFELHKLDDLKYEIEQHTDSQICSPDGVVHHYHHACEPQTWCSDGWKWHESKVLDFEVTSQVAAPIHCEKCNKVIGYTNTKV